MSGEYLGGDNDGQSGSAVATSEDISITKHGVHGDKDILLSDNGTLHQRKNVISSSDPEMGIDQNQHCNHNTLDDNQGKFMQIV